MKTIRAIAASLLLAVGTSAYAAPMSIAEMKHLFAALVAGRYAATGCSNDDTGSTQDGILTVSPDGHVVGPSVDMSMFDPAGTFGVERDFDGSPPSLSINATATVNGHTFVMSRRVPWETPGALQAGLGDANQTSVVGTHCGSLNMAAAKLAGPSFDLASDVAPVFATRGAVQGSCRSMKHGKGSQRDVQFTLDAHGVVVDGVTLPFGSASQPVRHAAVGSQFSDNTLNASFNWVDGSSFHVEQHIEGDGVATFGFTIKDKADAQLMFCTPRPAR